MTLHILDRNALTWSIIYIDALIFCSAKVHKSAI